MDLTKLFLIKEFQRIFVAKDLETPRKSDSEFDLECKEY